MPYLKNYSIYTMNYPKATSKLSNLLKKENFSNWIEKKSKEKSLEISSLIQLPVQTIPRYILFFNDLLKYISDDHFDFDSILESSRLLFDV